MKISSYILSGLLALLLISCHEDEAYPSLISEFADLQSSKEGISQSFMLDDGTEYGIANPVEKLKPNATYRMMVTYALGEDRKAWLYGLEGVYYLRDSSEVAKSDPTGVLSAWRAGKYINLQLAPKTQDGNRQYWGYCMDSITPHHAHLSLYHNQNGDPTSYSTTVYASLPVDSIKGIDEGDTITLSINTFKGTREWTMRK